MQKKQGISLIVLVVTIIVMIILVGAIILTLSNVGIIPQAEKAVDETNLEEVQTIAGLAWSEAFMELQGGEITSEKLEQKVLQKVSEEGIDLTLYKVKVTDEGVKVALSSGLWEQEGLKVRKGSVTLEIGDSISYDETNGGRITGLTPTDWKVLGASDAGELLIMSTSNVVTSYTLGYETTMTDDSEKIEECQKDWLTGPDQLDELCKLYGNGKGAAGARSIRVVDVNKVTGYDPEIVKYIHDDDYISEYGNQVTFSYNGTTTPTYTGSNGATGNLLNFEGEKFCYYNGEEFVEISDLITGTSGKVFATIKNNWYSYYPRTLTSSSSGEQKGIGKDTKAYKMLFGGTYWLASPWVFTRSGCVHMGMFGIGFSRVHGQSLCCVCGDFGNASYGVRAVVTLSNNINIMGSSASGWSI